MARRKTTKIVVIEETPEQVKPEEAKVEETVSQDESQDSQDPAESPESTIIQADDEDEWDHGNLDDSDAETDDETDLETGDDEEDEWPDEDEDEWPEEDQHVSQPSFVTDGDLDEVIEQPDWMTFYPEVCYKWATLNEYLISSTHMYYQNRDHVSVSDRNGNPLGSGNSVQEACFNAGFRGRVEKDDDSDVGSP